MPRQIPKIQSVLTPLYRYRHLSVQVSQQPMMRQHISLCLLLTCRMHFNHQNFGLLTGLPGDRERGQIQEPTAPRLPQSSCGSMRYLTLLQTSLPSAFPSCVLLIPTHFPQSMPVQNVGSYPNSFASYSSQQEIFSYKDIFVLNQPCWPVLKNLYISQLILSLNCNMYYNNNSFQTSLH